MRCLPLVPALVALCGCTSTGQSIGPDAQSQLLGGKTITYTERASPDFAAITPGRTLIPLFIGIIPAHAEGNEIVRKYNIPDPKLAIESSLLALMIQNFKVRVVEPPIKIAGEEADTLSRLKGGPSRLLLDVKSKHWFFAQIGLFRPNDYRV